MSLFIPGSQNISNVNKKVGINTTTPSTELDINGTMRSTVAQIETLTSTSGTITNLISSTISGLNSINASSGTINNLYSDVITLNNTVLLTDNNLLTSTSAIYVPGVSSETTGAYIGPTGALIQSSNKASPYPVVLNIENDIKYTECNLTVTLGYCNITSPSTIRMLLSSPNGKSILLMSDITSISGSGASINLNFSDQGGQFESSLVSGTYMPTGTTFNNMPYPAPGGPYVKTLAELVVGKIDGEWKLYVYNSGIANPDDVINYVVLEFQLAQQSTIVNLSSDDISSKYIYNSELIQTNDLKILSQEIHLGLNSGYIDQSTGAISIGNVSGYINQGEYAVAIGADSGYINQGQYAVAIGPQAGNENQGKNAVAIGSEAGYDAQGDYSIAIGNKAGYATQAANSIIINASEIDLNASTGGLYISPINNYTGTSSILSYNVITKEVFSSSNLAIDHFTSNVSSVSKKWYSFSGQYTDNTTPLQLSFTFDNSSFSGDITVILNNSTYTGASSVYNSKLIGGGYSTVTDNILLINGAVSSTSSCTTGCVWNLSSVSTNPTTTTISTLNPADVGMTLYYYINIEVIKGVLVSITDNTSPTPNSITFDY